MNVHDLRKLVVSGKLSSLNKSFNGIFSLNVLRDSKGLLVRSRVSKSFTDTILLFLKVLV